jgi:hypothetical protein
MAIADQAVILPAEAQWHSRRREKDLALAKSFEIYGQMLDVVTVWRAIQRKWHREKQADNSASVRTVRIHFPISRLYFHVKNSVHSSALWMRFDCLTVLQKNAPAMRAKPSQWMPWNYRETIARTEDSRTSPD